MPGESPLNMMRSAQPRLRKRRAAPRWRLWMVAVAVVVLLAIGLCWGWYLAAEMAGRIRDITE